MTSTIRLAAACLLGLSVACAGGQRAHLELDMLPTGPQVPAPVTDYVAAQPIADVAVLANADLPDGLVSILRYENAAGTTCLAVVGDRRSDEACPQVYGTPLLEFIDESGRALLLAPDGVTRVLFLTIYGYVIDVDVVAGVAYGEWNGDWGRLSAARLYGSDGELIGLVQ